MFRISLSVVMLACVVAAPSFAQQTQGDKDRALLLEAEKRMNAAPDASKQAVSTLTCDQMLAEMSVAGQMMSKQLDPTFAANAESLRRDALSGKAPAGPPTAEQAQQNRDRTDRMAAQVVGSMQGVDIQRMAAISQRFTDQKCPTPTGPPGHH